MLLVAYSLLLKNPKATEEEIREAISGNLCRCTGYIQIVEAIKESATLTAGARGQGPGST